MHLLVPIHPAVSLADNKKCFKTFGNLGRIVDLSSTETDAALENLIFLYGPKVQIF